MIDRRTEAAWVVHALLEHLVGPQQERLRNRQFPRPHGCRESDRNPIRKTFAACCVSAKCGVESAPIVNPQGRCVGQSSQGGDGPFAQEAMLGPGLGRRAGQVKHPAAG